MIAIDEARNASPEAAQEMLYQIGGVLPILMARAAMRPAASSLATNGKLEVRLPEAAAMLGVTESFLRDHWREYGGFKRGKFLMFSIKRLQDDTRRKAM